ncbi:hypothetical protein SteCoe_32667 [Stentor coeruleus]|uniref:Uncharacterized protein n=1 Tax=Stentor coeruleus TaxID=5963 RepID=A0A1R2AYI5_9CILI|nr:hypothetical protein SteCoe_32667 [Stentor coeruleus]
MGNHCSCLNNAVAEEKLMQTEKIIVEMDKSPIVDVKERDLDEGSHQVAGEVIIEVEFDIEQVITIQSMIRGFLDRHKAKKRTAANITKGIGRQKSHKKISRPVSLDSKSYNRQFLELSQDKVPDYLTPEVKNVQTSLGPFEYKGKAPKDVTKYGPVLLDNDSVYTGDWNQFKFRHGRGVQIWSDGAHYEGSWCNDKREGKGRMIYYNGNYYEGQWKEDQCHGFGTFVEKHGAKYEGGWNNGQKHGDGVETDAEGNVYEGKFENDKKHGYGKMQYSNGNFYEGEFRNGCNEGNGIYQWNDGRQYKGQWENNKMHGKGVFTWSDGRSYDGEYYEDKKNGFGTFIWADGRKYEGQWKNDKQDGDGIYTTRLGTRKGTWKNGKRINE